MRLLAFATALCALAATPLRAETVGDFYRGKTISLVISSSAGGGYDTLGRAVARYLPKHIPGAPIITVRNMPGAGGIVATNYLYTAAPKDGTVIGIVQNNTPFEPLFGTREAEYDATKFAWLGTPSQEVGILAVWHGARTTTIADARAHEITVAASGANSTPSFYARLLNAILDTKLRIVLGYPGQNESFLAMERGEVDGYPSIFLSSLSSTRPAWIREHKIDLLVQYGEAPSPDIAGVPFLADLVTREDDKLLARAAVAPLAFGRPFLAPPGTPPDRVAALRKGLMETFTDPEFVADAGRLQLDVANPRGGEAMQAQLEATYRTPVAVVERLRKLAQQQ